MDINGREVKFFYSIGARCDFEEFCAKRGSIPETIARIHEAVFLNKAYHEAHPEDKTAPLTVDEVKKLPNSEYEKLVETIARQELEDSELTVEAEEVPSKNAVSAGK